MNKDVQKFTETYLSIINEDADKKYHNIMEIAIAVKTTTNNCQDMWIKGQSGAAVLSCMSSWPENCSSVSDFELKYIANYWKGKAKSGNQFDTDMASNIERAVEDYLRDERYPHAFLRFKVGIIAYGVWKALNTKVKKEANNKAEIENSNVDQDYANISNKKLKVVDWKLEYASSSSRYSYYTSSYPSDWRFICLDENGFKVNVKVMKTDKIGCAIIELLDSLRVKNIPKEEAINKVGINEITIIKATLGKIYKEYKTIYLNRTVLEYPSKFSSVEAIESMKENMKNEIEEKILQDKLHESNGYHDIERIIEEYINEREFHQKPKEEQISWIKHMKDVLMSKFEKKAAKHKGNEEVVERLRGLLIDDLKDTIGDAFPDQKDEYLKAIFGN